MNLLLIYNPKAGQANDRHMESVIEQMREAQVSLECLSMFDENFVNKLINKTTGVDGVVSFGGDGTLNYIINKIMTHDLRVPPVIPYPSGTSNDFAQQLFGPNPSVEEILGAVHFQNYCYLDIGQVNDSYFANVLGIGTFAEIAYKTPSEQKQKYGMWAYWFEALKHLPTYQSITFTLDVAKGESHDFVKTGITEKGYLLLILNGRGAGGFKQLAPQSSLIDGKLDVVVIKDVDSLLRIASLLPKIIKGEHFQDDRISYLQRSSMNISTDVEVTSIVDGEAGPQFPLEVKVHRQSIPFYYGS